jgi:hypothetical protein
MLFEWFMNIGLATIVFLALLLLVLFIIELFHRGK